MNKVEKPVIVALDYPAQAPALEMAARLDPAKCRVKVGKELFTREGPAIVEALQKQGFDLFLDLKFHDIPNTVAKAVRAAAELGVWMVNVHASGGRRMMEAAQNELAQVSGDTKLIAVTVLTSMERSDLAEIGLDIEPLEQVRRLAKLTKDSGLDGVVCSAQEAQMLREEIVGDFDLVTPGIRPAWAAAGDQRRILTPVDAIRAGSSYLVVGRPITQSEDPARAVEAVLSEVASA
ncbi:orotidine-5'-phosphate decarboxylase [Marinobacterium mangrovicola]|uniref:Orotidine 5'-phosphate decarboxylase n=1 Tax=Marinobacterium mangrovicola TaxID=1476959 RepID=A0A4R1G5T2_9GAMM|nr:orotidine-5'-phosphate decarboxylase [Marinobacterium mangrovicola]TCK03034.1 orotidine-5'-phosphate decarboxylase [Marinobacterium mangrovicola]